MNKKDASVVARYNKAEWSTLRQVYGRWSDKKEQAYLDCRKRQQELNGSDFRIIGFCRDNFSVGFTFMEDGVRYLMYITKGGERRIRLEDN